ncbi:DUF885 domain-containing protein [Enteractinococcus coprophilus]|uniref:Uncharacterized protein (DUF885 family) n=1 Tax=Enteractinococcus coprophilus TaxID=1027633 RepID=A0A543AF80_9MICC|nr:DUF885 domain-containing protein [Enteractinococcus coprophilus]TQL71233.1 uncharacterized protein (DUF885 family) [Enteractinococcus coprophilus]
MSDSSIDALAEDYARQLADLNPVVASEIGLAGYADKLPDYSPEGAAALDTLQADVLKRLDALAPQSDQDLVTQDALIERLTVDRDLYATGVVPLNNIASPVQDIRATFDLMPTTTSEDWRNIAARLTKVDTALHGYRIRLDEAVTKGLAPVQRQVDACIVQAQAAAENFFTDLVASAPEQPNTLRTELDRAARRAAQAYADFATYLKDELRDRARTTDAVGKEYYALASQEFLGTQIDLAETYEWGLAELERIVSEQQRIAESIQPGLSIEEARQVLSADPARQLHGTEALRQWMQDLSDTTIEDMKQHFYIPPPMDYVEAMIAPTQDGGIYYTAPSEDFSRPGRMWWSVPEGEDTFTTWQQTTTVFHEGVPGHHLQVATAMFNATGLNSWRRNWLWVSGHGEGWALYAEDLMKELGYLNDPGDYLGMLDAQRMRAARVVFDIGVHCGFTAPQSWGGKTWDPETGFAFLQAHLNETPGVLEFEFVRYLGWPGQAPSYAVGKRIWQQIRAEHEQAPDFDLKTFHTRALQLGSMGLDTLERALR